MTTRARRSALGLSVHTGWAALVAVASGQNGPPALVDRRRIEMIPGADPTGPRFVFHAARELPLDEARRFVRESGQRALDAARRELRAAVETLASQGLRPLVCGLPRGTRAAPVPLETILASHSLVHAAEGALYRDAVRGAAEDAGMSVSEILPKELAALASRALGLSGREVARLLVGTGKSAGSPWAKDQKDAYLAACVALAG